MKKQKQNIETMLNGDKHKNFQIRIDHLFREKKKTIDQIIPQLKKEITYMQECAIIGSKEQPEYFDVFAEEKVLWLLMDLIKRTEGNKEIVICVIETLNMLILNIQEEKYLSLILSGIPQFISMQYDFSQEEIVDYYINLLKILSRKISNEKYLILYFNQIYNYFPLLWESSRFFNRRDSLINTTARNILLSVLESKKSEASQLSFKKYLRSLPFQIIITNYILDFKRSWLEASEHLYNQNINPLLDQQEKIKDYLCFFHDLKRIQPDIKKLVDNALLEYAILPSILNGFLNGNTGEKVCITLGLNILYLLLENLNDDNNDLQNDNTTPSLKQVIIYLLTAQNFGLETQKYQTKDPSWYDKEWKPITYWDSNLDYLKQKCDFIFNQEQEQKSQNTLINGFRQSISRLGSSLIRQKTQKQYIPNQLSEEIDDLERRLGLVSDKQSFLELIQNEINNPPIQSLSNNSDSYQGWYVLEKKLYPNLYLESIFLYLRGKDDTLLFSSLNFLDYLIKKKFLNISSDQELSKSFYETLINIIKTPMPIQDQTLQLAFKHLYRIISIERQNLIQPLFQILLVTAEELRKEVCNEKNFDLIYKEFLEYYSQTQQIDIEVINVRFDFKTVFEHQTIGSDISDNELCRQKFKVYSQLISLLKKLEQDYQLFPDLNPLGKLSTLGLQIYQCQIIQNKNLQSKAVIQSKNYLTIKEDFLYIGEDGEQNVVKSIRLSLIDIDNMILEKDQLIQFQV